MSEAYVPVGERPEGEGGILSRRWIAPAVIVAMFGFAVAVYGDLPDRVPSRWSFDGSVDETMPRWPGAFLTPALALGVWVLLPLFRRIDPRKRNYERFDETFWLLVNLLVLFFAGIEVLTLGAALGWPIDVSQAMMAGIGVVFVVLGNYLPRVRSNWWMGIRTPWTLESERVWRDTHRVAGRTFVIGGLLSVASLVAPAGVRPWIAMPALILAGLIPAVYSYLAWQRERRAA